MKDESIADYFSVGAVLWTGYAPIIKKDCYISVDYDRSHMCYLPKEAVEFFFSLGFQNCIDKKENTAWVYALRGAICRAGSVPADVIFHNATNSVFVGSLADFE